uniref:Uncharacterized protein n=1 Tax=Arundo donax TaxID=35708 RepID=A0A0A8ZPH5_ARUDO
MSCPHKKSKDPVLLVYTYHFMFSNCLKP